jgi:glycosyltransferase involved in cell wall biosynthesis
VVPNAIKVEAYAEVRSGAYPLPEGLENHRANILFLGNFFHPPNREAAQILIEEVYPRLQRSPVDTRLLLVGSNPTALMLAAAQQDTDIIVTGEVPDVRPYLAAANVMIVPLFKGGGTRFKILEAFAAGCPVVSTTKGAEGLGVEDGKHLLIADEVDAMVAGVQRIWKENDLRKRMADAAYELVRSTYSWDAAAECVANALVHCQ